MTSRNRLGGLGRGLGALIPITATHPSAQVNGDWPSADPTVVDTPGATEGEPVGHVTDGGLGENHQSGPGDAGPGDAGPGDWPSADPTVVDTPGATEGEPVGHVTDGGLGENHQSGPGDAGPGDAGPG